LFYQEGMSDALFDLPETPAEKNAAYRVLARKYRPQNFDQLKGQDALVRTLTNAFASNRIAHAFILTGVRGVGKTTTARIIAKGLNCESGPTITPCGKCATCVSIAEGRNVDVIELDAASHTGVDNIRQILDNVKYAPTSVRTKVYIIDEVHMLSTSSFNALLKTLEEPPPHVKFILATTEIRKVPVTILSRCQRFDLRRIEPDVLQAHFAEVSKAEGITVEDEALQLLAKAADGSARDGLSLLDQAIARGGTTVTAEAIRDMLGLAERTRIYDLLGAALKGEVASALSQLTDMHKSGAEPLGVLQDLLDATHQLARLKALPEGSKDLAATSSENDRMSKLASEFSTPALARAWQVLLKGVGEVQGAPRPLAALEMLIIRLAHMGTLPPPGDLVKKLEGVNAPAATSAPLASAPSSAPVMKAAVGMSNTVAIAQPATLAAAQPQNWRAVVALFAERKELQLYGYLYGSAECLRFAPGQLEVFLRPGTPPGVAQRVTALLQEWTGSRWLINLARTGGAITIAEEDEAKQLDTLKQAAEHPLVKAVLLAFPGAKIEAVREKMIAAPVDDSPDATLMSDEE
jgi:DNA polymerase-3 subunit gamma/tau